MKKAKCDPAEVERLYRSGLSLRMVAKDIGISLQRVQQILVARNVPRRPKHVTSRASNYTATKPVDRAAA